MLWHRAAQHAKREGGVGLCMPYTLRVRKSCPECGVHVLCRKSVKKGLCEVTCEKN